MKTPWKLFIIATFISVFTKAQVTYFDYIEKAEDFYFKDKNYLESAKAYDMAFKANKGKSIQSNFYNAACMWALANKPEKAVYYLKLIINNNKIIPSWSDPSEFYNNLQGDQDLESLRKRSDWSDLLAKAKRNKEQFETGMNESLSNEISGLREKDQALRLKLDELRKDHTKINSPEEKELLSQIKIQDAQVLKQAEEIIEKNGWPALQKVGYKNSQTMWLIIQHADPATMKKYYSVMKTAAEKGELLPRDFAFLEDRMNMYSHKLQMYGSQTVVDRENKKFYLYPVEQVDQLDQRRASVGLESIKKYLKAYNIDWDIVQYKEQLPALIQKSKVEL
ncbi:hypothetical protein KRE47_03630 [Elizabethkingia meningoseptica]|uniref:DUF6624 domain-containing protein n=1 Tax=Elizabethkingia meningoseptica TaxID=238 RepID=UPI0022F1975C|nr:DUF6624 domain-containing protein [Elizabethkingia meningoseptica]EJK5327911.1 hypothetical protein [Elizabethkingia meningoseptica]MDE5466729.1 hypothetical protein [Elizabethkingia meningoseptica]MDE5474041.1 hypothetical protein [Elizabethkingia meningoseptica]MDE5477474.1 hypothetical protein [Elizabethkingia meningoseptica]MDE5484048.1 hypothetical protein [Elizabethkingia meningoseptica]